MDNNYYYPSPQGHPLPPNQQHGGGSSGPIGGSQVPPQQQQGHQMMHSPLPQPSARLALPPSHLSHHQQTQPQHQNYQQIHPSHGLSVSHSNSTHAQQQTQHPHHNHQSNMTGPLPPQIHGPQHVHSQSPHHHGTILHHMQPLNQMVRSHVGPAIINHQHGLNQPITHHQQNFFNGGPNPSYGVHYHSQNQHPHSHSAHHHIHHQHQPQLMHHGPPPQMANHFPHHMQQGIGRHSPYFPNIHQTEFRIIDMNRRLQCRPLRYSSNPMPSHLDEHALWWDRFASEFFEDDATLTLRLTLEEKPVEYTIGRTLIPRFFRTYFDGGVTDLSINLRNPKETCIHPHIITLDCDQASIVTNNIFKFTGMPSNHGVVVHTEGHLIIDYVSNNFDSLSIKSWRFYTKRSHEYIDRAIISTMGLATNYLTEPITKQGLTKSTITYLKMCMIMEPMQELMYQHKQTKMDPRACLRNLLYDRYKYRSGEDTRAATNKRRKRKPSATPTIGSATSGAVTNKKTKTAMNNNAGLNNNILMSPSALPPNFSLTSQDVMVVGEPSMMGGDFGDDNERMITRLENTRYDPSASTPSICDGTSLNALNGNDNTVDNAGNGDATQEQSSSPASIEQASYQQSSIVAVQSASPQQANGAMIDRTTQVAHHPPSTPLGSDQQHLTEPQHQTKDIHSCSEITLQQSKQKSPELLSPKQVQQASDDKVLVDKTDQPALSSRSGQNNHTGLPHGDQQDHAKIEKVPIRISQVGVDQEDSLGPVTSPDTDSGLKQKLIDGKQDEAYIGDAKCQHQNMIKVNSALTETNNSEIAISFNLHESIADHSNSIENLNDESNSNSQLASTTADKTSAIEQQQPVDNGVV